MATIKEVAKKANVSVSVVSKAFNDYKDIKEETRQKIFAVAKELNYSPNLNAKNLSSKKQMTFALISSGVLNDNEKDPNAFEIFKGIYRAVSESRFDLSVCLIDSQNQMQQSYVQYCRERNIGGAILQGIRTDDPYYQELLDTKLPCVVLDIISETDNGVTGSVSIDNVKASKEMTAYLLERNHREIIIMAGTPETYVNKERIRGVEEALLSCNMGLSDLTVLEADFSEEKAYKLAAAYLQAERPTAFLCFSDLMAMGVMKAILETGLRIPEDISVTGFDDVVFSRFTQPPLTTIRQDFAEIGKNAAKLLQGIKENKAERKHIRIQHQLMERDSVKALINDGTERG